MTHPADADTLSRILDLAQACLDDPEVGAEELARRGHLSRFHFDRLVSATTGEPPGALRRRILLERAAWHLLRHSHRTILDVAVEAGYSSHEAFTRAFARAFSRTPSALRADPPLTFFDLELPAPSGVHFRPPGGLRLPASHQETSMDVLHHLIRHHVDSLTRLIEASSGLSEEVLDRPISLSVEAIDDDMTLRRVLDAMVTQEEHWLSALRGGGWPDRSEVTVAGLATRHEAAGRDWLAFVDRALAEGQLADTFVDTTCDPPTTQRRRHDRARGHLRRGTPHARRRRPVDRGRPGLRQRRPVSLPRRGHRHLSPARTAGHSRAVRRGGVVTRRG